jgi:hypothetical protein
MFNFLVNKGVPSHLLKAIRAFYVGNTAKLRVDNLLSTVINVTLGVLEGSCLSPFLFSTVFSVVWEFVTCSDFPSDRPRVLQLGGMWLIAFADDVVLLSTDPSLLQDVLSNLFTRLKEFNLCMNLVKTESLTFLPPRVRVGVGSYQFVVDKVPLNQIEEFKYLGIFVQSKWGYSSHIARMRGRAEAAASELLKLITTLDIRRLDRITVYARALVESQWHGLELLPRSVVDEIETTRAHLMKKLFNLPSPTATNLTLVLFDLWPANFEAISRRVAFARKMFDHDLAFVRDAFSFDRSTMMRAQDGWHNETFLLFQSMFRSEKVSDFSIERISSRLSPIARSRTQFIYHLLQATDEATLAPFRLFKSPDTLVSFREVIGTISKSSADFLLLICSSGHRFRFFNRTTLKCPLCPCSSWLTAHLFTCPVVENLLARNGVSWDTFKLRMGNGDWKEVLFLLYEVMLVWKNTFQDCAFDDSALQALYRDAELL